MTNLPDDSQSAEFEFQSVARVGDLAENQGQTVPLGGHLIGLFLSDGHYFAISDLCPHQGASLSAGYVEGGLVMCPWHAWKFQLADGCWADAPKSPLKCQTFPVRVEQGEIFIGIPRA